MRGRQPTHAERQPAALLHGEAVSVGHCSLPRIHVQPVAACPPRSSQISFPCTLWTFLSAV